MPPIVLETFKIFQIEMDIILQLKLKYNEPLIVARNDHETLLQNEQDSKIHFCRIQYFTLFQRNTSIWQFIGASKLSKQNHCSNWYRKMLAAV